MEILFMNTLCKTARKSKEICTRTWKGNFEKNKLCESLFLKSLMIENPTVSFFAEIEYDYINTKMCVCLCVCSRFSRPFGIRLGYPLAQSFIYASNEF